MWWACPTTTSACLLQRQKKEDAAESRRPPIRAACSKSAPPGLPSGRADFAPLLRRECLKYRHIPAPSLLALGQNRLRHGGADLLHAALVTQRRAGDAGRMHDRGHLLPSTGVETNIWREDANPANVPEVALRKGPIDRQSIVPQPPERDRSFVSDLRHWGLIADDGAQHLPNRSHNIRTIAAGEAMDEDRGPALPDRKARGPIFMGGATDHRVATIPAATEALDDRKSIGRGLVGQWPSPLLDESVTSRCLGPVVSPLRNVG